MRVVILISIIAIFVGCSSHRAPLRRDLARMSGTHIVERGDTFFSIAKKYGVSVDSLLTANRLSKDSRLQVGQPIYLPGSSPTHALQTPKTPSDDDTRTIALSWPVEKGVVFRTFDQTPSRLHEGLSIGAPANTPVKAAQDGEVIYAAQAPNHLGKMILVKHADPFVSIYGHIDVFKVKVGQKVKKGEVIGTVGTTGGAESPRVYFELRKDRMPVNPEPFLSKTG